ncbi:reticulon-3 [Gastrophryne carolinensis]
MAEPGVQQSSHITSSSTEEKCGSCPESHAKHPSPESPGSPFEMIAHSSGFDFKEGEEKAVNYGLPPMSALKPCYNQEVAEPLVSYTNPVWSVDKEESCYLKLHSGVDPNNDDLEHEISIVESKEKHLFGTDALLARAPESSTEESDYIQSLESRGTFETSNGSTESEARLHDLNSVLRWAEADEDMDSSGESDDTVIDAGWRVRSSEYEQRERGEDGWVELRNAQQKNDTEKKDLTIHKTLSDHFQAQPSTRYNDEQSNGSTTKTPESPHGEGFVDLSETCCGAVHISEPETLENQVQENLTIEALRALAEGTQDWNSESPESSPEILCSQLGSFEVLKMTDIQDQSESSQDSKISMLTFKVHDLLYWRDVKKSGMVFGAAMVLLLSLAAFSIISVISYLVLSLMTVTIGFRVYKSVMQAVQKSDEGHPFRALLDQDITLTSDNLQRKVNSSLVHVNHALKRVIRLFFVEDLIDSLKLALFMWLMTYVGAVFNGITLLILGVLIVFTAPIVYEKYKVQIDHYVSLVHNQVKAITEKIQAKLPGALKKKTE